MEKLSFKWRIFFKANSAALMAMVQRILLANATRGSADHEAELSTEEGGNNDASDLSSLLRFHANDEWFKDISMIEFLRGAKKSIENTLKPCVFLF